MGGAPFFVQKNAIGCEAELIVGCRRDKHRRCIRWYGRVFESCGGRVDRGYERGSPFRCVLEAGSGCDLPTRREADDAHTVGRNAPFGGVLTNVSNRSKTVSVGLRNDFTDDLPKLLPVCNQRREFLRRILASVRKAVLQNKRGDALRRQILGHEAAFTRDGESHKAAARAHHDRRAVLLFGCRFENRERGLRHVGDDFRVPSFRELLFLRIVPRSGARRRALIERNDILRGCERHCRSERCCKEYEANGPQQKCSHGPIV